MLKRITRHNSTLSFLQFPDPVSNGSVDMIKLRFEIEKELSEVARRETKSVLMERGYPGLTSFAFEDILTEVRNVCPTVFSLLSCMIQLDLNREKNIALLALFYGIIMFKRFHELSRLQRLNIVLFSEGNARKEVTEFTFINDRVSI